MRSSSLLWVFIPILTFHACSNAGNSNYEPSTANKEENYADSTGASRQLSDGRKRIKTADIRCRVNDVVSATSGLEKLVVSLNGVVVESNLRNEETRHHEYPWSADSLKRVTTYSPLASLTLKVPSQRLDTVVHALTNTAARISHRVLKDTDVTLSYLRNQLHNKAGEKHRRDTAHSQREKELDLSRYDDAKQADVINRTIHNMGIDDEVAFSTITVELFQPEMTDVQVVLNPERLSRPPMGVAAVTALQGGLEFFRAMLLFLLRLWPVFVIGALTWFAYKKLALKR
ncbi:DUF4349 domain-containing protein [Chitinophaga sp. GCM10012297]|uniref:DUF4349 domain-containing protein n=1 Tax=Chitinophaga chungangae TaxID=2821488 RepID=A0ABS3YBF9_9BACT|nr:DUF4349 domain-containing protein [Chitinophaga chungangae]MBO9151999.1 DUF4349 domain-containing protein [Chitinophaga chungangae]